MWKASIVIVYRYQFGMKSKVRMLQHTLLFALAIIIDLHFVIFFCFYVDEH